MNDKLKFLEWMAYTIKSVHYANSEEMERAMERISDPTLQPLK